MGKPSRYWFDLSPSEIGIATSNLRRKHPILGITTNSQGTGHCVLINNITHDEEIQIIAFLQGFEAAMIYVRENKKLRIL